ncbi:GNAT family N-acetyltransferase [Herminiimonas fonticola]|uniref:ElaA protein n=1 Tax=Herminiimonas fonticola TaxID=303380 RepID=A0A4R6GFX0_9BURK|nr:GNAT family N-acetyltransferase [Herminiimonas fonticola]RBA24649.1 putative acyltransferase [Herminiimonas fonticola]TDN93766.1 ElaA protein [Herminiimonas fonticola]
MIVWQWATFDELDAATLCAVLAARQDVFVLEQQCLYADIDGNDQRAFHLIGRHEDTQQLAAYLRCFAPGDKYPEAALGRVLTVQSMRGLGLGKLLMAEGIRRVEQYFPGAAIRISAQEHLVHFYGAFGFHRVSDTYLEDGIPHIEMFRE